jgi:CDP-diacylglycerol--glycerol-3-phosphate 3-phosphatidyltransferase
LYNQGLVQDRQIQIHTTPSLWPPTWPMGLTFLRLLLLPVFLWAILIESKWTGHPYRWLALAVFVVMAITDKLDGYLARRLNQTSKLGAVLDPVADKLLVACTVIVLNFEWIAPAHFRIPTWVVAAVYGKDLIIAIGVITLLALVGKITIQPRPLGKLSTVVQLSMVMAVLLAPPPSAPWFEFWRWFVRLLWWAVCVIAAAACLDYVIQGARQFADARRARTAQAPASLG